MRLQLYILRNLLRNFLLVLVVVTALVFLVGLGQSVGRFQGLGLSNLLYRSRHLIPTALTLAIPLALLVGVLLTYGRLSADNEILAMRMGGMHPFHALAPALLLGLALCLATHHVAGTLAPEGQARARRITKDDLRRLFDSLEARRGRGFKSDRMTIHWKEVDPDGWLVDFRFEVVPEDGVKLDGAASRARISKDDADGELQFALKDLEMGDATDEHRAEWEVLSFPIDQLFGVDAAKRRRNLLTNEELRYLYTRAQLLGRDPKAANLVRMKIEYYGRISLALACVVFALVGAPMGIIFRRGSFMASGFVALVVAFVIFYPLREAGKSLAEFRGVAPALAMSLPCIVLGVLGLVLLSRVLSR